MENTNVDNIIKSKSEKAIQIFNRIRNFEICLALLIICSGIILAIFGMNMVEWASYLIAFVVAYITTLRPIFRSPRLFIFIDRSRCSPPEESKDTASWFIRLGISNYGVTAAKECVGRLIGVWETNGKPIEKFDPLTLYWARQNQKHTGYYPVKIHGFGDVMYLDIAQLKKNELTPLTFRVAHDLSFPKEDGDSPSPGSEPVLKPGVYYIQIAIFADGVSIPPKWYEISIFKDIPDCNGSAPYQIIEKKPKFI